jgi:hypothetical protein
MHLADLSSYVNAQAAGALQAARRWARKAILNVALGRFSSDRTITEYAVDVWGTEPASWTDRGRRARQSRHHLDHGTDPSEEPESAGLYGPALSRCRCGRSPPSPPAPEGRVPRVTRGRPGAGEPWLPSRPPSGWPRTSRIGRPAAVGGRGDRRDRGRPGSCPQSGAAAAQGAHSRLRLAPSGPGGRAVQTARRVRRNRASSGPSTVTVDLAALGLRPPRLSKAIGYDAGSSSPRPSKITTGSFA